jgi:KDO2-lipid IV(A) lauroyltransferase
MAEYAVNERFYQSRYLRYEGLENLQNLSRPPILITGHMGNFELAASCCVYQGRPVSTISDLSLNPIQRSIAVAVRSRCFARAPGSYMIEAGPATMRHVLQAMARGQILVFYCDEYKDNLVWGPSLGRDVPLRGNRVLAAKLAHKFQAPIVPVSIRREGGCNLVSVTEPPIYRPESDRASIEEIANRIDQRLESWVRTNYDQWYWAPQLALERPFPKH